MKNTLVLLSKEIRSLFNSWVAYLVLTSFIFLSGLTFNISMEMFDIMTKYSDGLETGPQTTWNLAEHLVDPLYETVFILLFIMVPAITMRAFAEEKKQRTEELLLTSPIRIGEIVMAKYLAAASLVLMMMLPVLIYPGIVIYYGSPSPDWGTMLSGYLGLLMVGFSLTAIGLFASTLTENQIVAFVLTVALEMIFFIMVQATVMVDVITIGGISVNLGAFFRAFSISEHFIPLRKGILKASDIVYFVSLAVFWLWATKKAVESRRW